MVVHNRIHADTQSQAVFYTCVYLIKSRITGIGGQYTYYYENVLIPPAVKKEIIAGGKSRIGVRKLENAT